MQIKFFKTEKNFKKKNLDLNPNFYWKLIVCSVFLLTIASFVFGYYLFSKVREEPNASAEEINKKPLIKKERIDKVFEDFSSREKKSVEIISLPAPVVDPSL